MKIKCDYCGDLFEFIPWKHELLKHTNEAACDKPECQAKQAAEKQAVAKQE